MNDGWTGRAVVVGACGGLVPLVPFQTVVPLVVDIVQSQPYFVGHITHVTQKRYPLAGDTVEIVADPAQPLRLEVDWEQLPTIDERLAAGDAAFTDPDAVAARVAAAQQELVDAAYFQQDQSAGENAALLHHARELALPLLAHAAPAAVKPDGPSARVVADSVHGWQPGSVELPNVGRTYGELLLSVSVPGRPRFGARIRGLIPVLKDFSGDVPVEVDDRDPAKVKIPWDQVPGIFESALHRFHDDVRQAQANLAALSQADGGYLAKAIEDPAMHEQMANVMRQAGLDPQAGFAALEAMPEVVERWPSDLARLEKLHEAGVLTDDELASEKARLGDTT